MRILITGAAGMLGQDVSAAAQAAGHEPISLPRAELDIADRGAVDQALAEAAPDVVVNCAAWTDVDGAESAYERALAVNGPGAGNVARAAARAGAWTIHVSTDYVFDGAKRVPYVESDPVRPGSGYGRLFGPGGGCFPKTILRLAAERDRLAVVDDQVGCPTFTGHLAAALVELAARGERAPVGVLHVAGGGECSWFEFSREILAGVEGCEVVPVTSAEFVRPAPRPAYSVLRSERGAPALPHWRQGLSEYMALTANVPAS
jgi:dTDP-4-dehydrorhamnose reductase